MWASSTIIILYWARALLDNLLTSRELLFVNPKAVCRIVMNLKKILLLLCHCTKMCHKNFLQLHFVL